LTTISSAQRPRDDKTCSSENRRFRRPKDCQRQILAALGDEFG
jgi:hypothetical protein